MSVGRKAIRDGEKRGREETYEGAKTGRVLRSLDQVVVTLKDTLGQDWRGGSVEERGQAAENILRL